MNNLLNLVCANGVMVTFYVLDVILILCAIGISVWFYVKYVQPKKAQEEKENRMAQVEKIDEDTYVIDNNNEEESAEEVVEETQPKSNRVEHFVNQITEINEPSTNELKSNTVVMNKEVEMPEKKIVKKEEIENFVIVDGVKKEKTEPEKVKTFNRGANAFKNSTNFLNSIKEEQDDGLSSNKEAKTTTKTTKTTTKKKTTSKK